MKKKQAQSARKLGRVIKGKMREQVDEILEMPQDKVKMVLLPLTTADKSFFIKINILPIKYTRIY